MEYVYVECVVYMCVAHVYVECVGYMCVWSMWGYMCVYVICECGISVCDVCVYSMCM